MNRKIWVGWGLSSLICLVLAMSFSVALAQEVFRFGAYLPLTGWGANYGEDAKRGIDLAIQELNSKGGIRGKKVGVLYEDSGGNPKQAVSAVQKLINVDKVPVIIGGVFSTEALAIGPICQSNKVPTIATQASHQDVTKAGEYVFRIAPPIVMHNLMMEYAYKVIGARRLAALLFSTDQGRMAASIAEETFPKLGGKVVKVEFFQDGTTDFKINLLKIKQENPDVMYIWGGLKETAQIIKQMQELGMKLPIIGSNMFREPKLWELVGDPLKGTAYPNWAPEPATKARYEKFISDYRSTYGFEPKTVTATFTYEAAKLAIYALENGGTTGEKAQKVLATMRNFPGITGEITFINGERKAQYCIEKIMGPGVFQMTDFCTYL